MFKGNRVLIVIKRETPQKAIENAVNIINEGIENIEITFNTPKAEEVIAELVKNHKEINIGAGTVMNSDQAQLAISAGAKFIVSPGFIEDVSDFCKNHKVLYIPGVITPTEICSALNNGWDVVKLFPSDFVGIKYIKSLISGPFPNLKFMPTAGVNGDNLKDWFDAGAVAVGMSGSLLTDDISKIKSEIEKIKKGLNR